MHPVGGAPGVQQPLVGGGQVDLRPAQQGRPTTLLPTARGGHASGPRCAGASLGARCAAEPGAQRVLAGAQLLDRHELLLLVREHRVAGAVVDRRHAQAGEPGDVGPSELRVDLAADGLHERTRRGDLQTGERGRRRVGDLDLEPVEELLDEHLRLRLRAVRRVAVVDRDHALVGQHVAGHPAADVDRVQALVVLQPVDDRPPCVVLPEAAEHLTGPVDRVDAAPGSCRVRALSAHGHVDAQGALAAGLDDRVARLHQDREVGLDQVGPLGRDPAEPVVDVVDLLALVEHEGHVAVGLRHRVREPQRDGDPALHVAGAQPVQLVAVVAHRAGCG